MAQHSEVTAMGQQHLTGEMLARERVANIRKHWVRLVTACNSRCVFCLDTDTPRGVYLPEDEVHRELIRGRNELHADKVILSGGEGSIHPKFIDFIRFAKDLGYSRIQTVTNGVMLSKKEFYRAAVDAGLGEITYSLHGHTPELHDRLTATPGAFHKLMKGMMRAIREGRIIVNVDVCINKQNVPYIDQIVDLCLQVGVREFDLLHVIPQGVAFENRKDLFYDPVEHLPRLQKVFRLNRHPGVVIWTNRFPLEYLEGLEDLIQDPHKMLDEVNGRRFQVRKYLDEGKPLECRDIERCQYCFIESFCTSADRVIARQNAATWDVWWIGTPDGAAATAGLTRETLPFGARYVGLETADLADLEHLPVPLDVGLYVKPQQVTRMVEREVVGNRLVIVARDAAQLDVLLADTALPAEVAVEIELNQSTAPWLLAHRERVQSLLAQVHLRQPSHEFLKDAVADDVRRPQEFFAQLALPIRVSGLPACMTPGAQLSDGLAILRQSMFDMDTGRLAIRELARAHVVDGYFGKSLRCRDCRLNDRCEGAHINFIRDQGFAQMEPLREGPWADAAEAQVLALHPEKPVRLRDGRPLEPVAPSLPGFAPPQPAPEEPLIELGRKAREARERRRLEFEAAQPVPEN
ncbi:MAG TPA: radical SAM protein [Candidatus Dormibacteraeota bacterium]|nr:radical SAM protein [Candidatus Dormibacteraeota bacterium]